MTRDDVKQWVAENQIELALLNGMDDAIVGIADDGLENPKVVYSKAKILKSLQEQGMTRKDALEWYSYNVVGGLPNMGNIAPCIIDDTWVQDPESCVVN